MLQHRAPGSARMPSRRPATACRNLLRTHVGSDAALNAQAPDDSDADRLGWKVAISKRILAFAAPALVLPLSDPVMSLIDTVCLGRCAGTLELAALGPTSTVFAFASYVFNALGIATTASVAAAVGAGEAQHASDLATSALTVAFAFGVIGTAVLLVFGPQLIAATGAAAAIRPGAETYLRIRAFAQPALLVGIVTQSSLLAQKDSRSPALSVALQGVVNVVLDVALIAGLGAGVAGAAYATVAAQYLGMLMLLQRLYTTGKVRYRRRFAWRRSMVELWRTLAPLAVMYVARNLCYMILQVAAASLPPVKLAAHQVVWSMYTISSFATTTLEQSALAFMPACSSVRERRALVVVLMTLGALVGAALGTACILTSVYGAACFTADAGVHVYMRAVAGMCGAVLVVVGLDVAATATLISRGATNYLARSFVITLACLAAFMRVVGGCDLPMNGVWSGLMFFFAARAAQSYAGVALLRRSGRL